jgi:hypothetical protein
VVIEGVHPLLEYLCFQTLPPNVLPYCHPFAEKNEIEKIVQELIESSVIHPSTNLYYSPVVMILKKEGT